MGRSISVKVAKDKVVRALKARIEEGKKAVISNEKKREAHKKALDKYQKQVVKDFAKDLTISSVNTRWNGQLEVTYDVAKGIELPEQPKCDELEREIGSWEVQEIENAIRILEMSDEEFVNASTMKQIASYL